MMPGDNYSRHVLVLSGVPETVEVLQAVLEPQGIRVSEVRSPEKYESLACDLVVVHDGEYSHYSSALELPLHVPRIYVDCTAQEAIPADFCSPFHYGDLLIRIQELLELSALPA